MAKDIKYSRTELNGAVQTTAPTERTQIVPRPVPELNTHTGLEGLSDTFAQFFGQVSGAIGSVEDGVMIGEKKRIEQENLAQKRKAVGDVLGGNSMDPSLTNDYDYYDTYRSVLAVKSGAEAADTFDKWYREEWYPKNPTGDLRAARDDWIKKNLAGAQDKEFEGMVLDSFVKASEGTVTKQTENAARTTIAQGKDNLNSAIDAEVKAGDLNPDRIAYYIGAARTLDPLNPVDAAPFVAGAIAVAIQNHPEQSNAVLATLAKPGTGVNGKSFSESFPDAYAGLQTKAVTAWTQTNTMEEWGAVDALKQRADKFYAMTDSELFKFGADLTTTMNKYGSAEAVQSLRTQLGNEYERRAKAKTSISYVESMLLGQAPLDHDALTKGLPLYIQAKFGTDNIFQIDPTALANVFVRAGGVVPEDYKLQLSNALTSFNDPAAQQKAALILNQIQKQRDVKFADGFLSDEASRYFHHIAAEQNVTGESLDAVIPRANSIRRESGGKDVQWSDIIKDTPDKVKDRVSNEINGQIRNQMGVGGWLGMFGTAVQIPPGLQQTIEDYALQVVTERGAQGVSWQDGIKEAIGRVLNRSEVLPQNGKYVFAFDTDLNPLWTDADGKPHERIRLGFNTTNPATAKSVNTVAVYENELKTLGEKIPSVLPTGKTADVSLAEHPFATVSGSYGVMQGGDWIVYEPGEKITLALPDGGYSSGNSPGVVIPTTKSAEVTIPDDPQQMQDTFGELLPPGFGFTRIPLADGKSGWMLSYRPNFGDQAGTSLDAREQNFSIPSTLKPSPSPLDVIVPGNTRAQRALEERRQRLTPPK